MYTQERYRQDPERAKRNARNWRLANLERRAGWARRYREQNKEAIRQSKRAYAATHREQIAAQQAAWYQANRERILAKWVATRTDESRAEAVQRTCAWIEANRERRREHHRKWRRENPDKAAAITNRRRARKRGAAAETVILTELLADQHFICYLCGDSIDPNCKYPDPRSGSIDHIIPLSRGGTGLRENLRACHMGCNSAKCDRLPGESTA